MPHALAGSAQRPLRALAIPLLLVSMAAVAVPLLGSPASAAAGPVTVSLTFDDGTSDHLQAAQVLESHGVRGTFYVSSGRAGQTGYLTWDQLSGLQAAGHEVAGHTVTHANLPALDPDEARRQVCDDRSALLGHGLAVRSFAFPFGADDATTRQIVQDCGYQSGRDVGGLTTPTSCSGCADAEPLPVSSAYRWALRTPDSVKAGTTLPDMQSEVLRAEQSGGGWIPYVFHRICPDTSCDPYSTTPSQLDAFVAWLVGRGTVVRTVGDVVGGEVKPAVAGPAPASGGTADNLLRNPSMETDTDANGVPDCWQHGGYGTNTFRWTRSTPGHSGQWAERVDVTSFTSGDRRLLSPQDLGSCAPTPTVGRPYRFTGWYQSSGTVQLVAYYRTSSGTWTYWTQSPVLPASSAWRQSDWTTPAVPAAAVALSVGWSVRSAGWLVADDAVLRDADATAPTVAVTAPADGAMVRGSVPVSVSASDAGSGVDHVDVVIDDVTLCTVTALPATCTWDTTLAPDHAAAVTARAVDRAGNSALASTSMVTVANDPPPAVIESPSPTPTSVSASPTSDTPTASPTGTASPTPSATLVEGGSATPTPDPSTPTSSPSPTASPTPTPTPTASALLRNGSFEDDVDRNATADCWQHGGYGTNTFVWSRVTGRTGAWAERVSVSSFTSGDRRLITPQNAPACAPAALQGHRYTVTGWYRTSAKVQLVVYYLSASGVWTYWTQGGVLPTSSGWASSTFTTPPVPSGATALSVGWSVRSSGWLEVDDASLTDLG